MLSGSDWLRSGYSIWQSPDYQVARDFFILKGDKQLEGPAEPARMMQPEMIMAYVKNVLAELNCVMKLPNNAGWTF